MKKSNFKGCLILGLTAVIWGVAFIAQSEGMEHIEPFTFTFCRSLLGAVVLLPVGMLLGRKTNHMDGHSYRSKKLWTAGISSGAVLFVAMSFQQMGIIGTSAGKTAFITALYIVFAPIIAMIFGKRPKANVFVGIAVGILGMYLLCMGGESGISKSDLLVFACSVCFSVQILVIDEFSSEVDCVKMSCIQFAVCTVLSVPFMLIFETPSFGAIKNCALPLLYTGVLSSAVAYTLQIVGQKYADVTPATLTMSLESVFAAVAGWIMLDQKMNAREIIGCLMIFAAIVVAQLSFGKSSKSNHAKTAENES